MNATETQTAAPETAKTITLGSRVRYTTWTGDVMTGTVIKMFKNGNASVRIDKVQIVESVLGGHVTSCRHTNSTHRRSVYPVALADLTAI